MMSGSPKVINMSRTRILPDPDQYERATKFRFENDQNEKEQSNNSNGQSNEKLIALKTIGKGSFGTVFLAETSFSHNIVAVKVLEKLEMLRRSQAGRLDNERQCLEICSKKKSPYFPALYGCYQSKLHLFIIQEFAPGGELYFHLGQESKMTPRQAKFIAAECFLALHFLHENNIIYRDFKPENVMFDLEGHIKLVDFGLAKVVRDKKLCYNSGGLSFVGTTEYLAPEMILKSGHGFAVDFWALGMVLYEMLTGLPPWYSDDTDEITDAILHRPVSFMLAWNGSALFDTNTRNLIAGLLSKNPNKRLGSHCAEEIKLHRYFTFTPGFSWSSVVDRSLTPAFKPVLADAKDVSNFDTQFTDIEVAVEKNYSVAAEQKKIDLLPSHEFFKWKHGEVKDVFTGFQKSDIF